MKPIDGDALIVAIEQMMKYQIDADDICEMIQNFQPIEPERNGGYQLPPAQPEQLTDKEQRIFLAAMGREEKVCKEVDDGYRQFREPYEDSLVRTCHEITRKVKGALWMI